jgi:D-glycero-alpha-D-manno-heptose-7-phosphate kinase
VSVTVVPRSFNASSLASTTQAHAPSQSSESRAPRIITRSRAPLRLGLAGGGTDLSPFCDEFGGAVLNWTIDRFAYAFIERRSDGKVEFCAKDIGVSETFDISQVAQSKLLLHRGVYQRISSLYPQLEPLSVTITTTVDAPPGSGLGSSSALVVALVEAFRTHLALPLGPYDVARLAYQIERIDLALSGGRQDQYAAAFGGPNFIEFLSGDRVVVNPLRVHRRIIAELETSLVTCFSGRSRDSAAIIDQQTSRLTSHADRTVDAMHSLKADAHEMKRALLEGDIDEIAAILDRSWLSKKATAAAVSNARLEELFELARSKGAIGGKVSGAGGGGFMMLIVPPEDRLQLVEALNAANAVAGPVKFVDTGCEAWQAIK